MCGRCGDAPDLPGRTGIQRRVDRANAGARAAAPLAPRSPRFETGRTHLPRARPRAVRAGRRHRPRLDRAGGRLRARALDRQGHPGGRRHRPRRRTGRTRVHPRGDVDGRLRARDPGRRGGLCERRGRGRGGERARRRRGRLRLPDLRALTRAGRLDRRGRRCAVMGPPALPQAGDDFERVAPTVTRSDGLASPARSICRVSSGSESPSRWRRDTLRRSRPLRRAASPCSRTFSKSHARGAGRPNAAPSRLQTSVMAIGARHQKWARDRAASAPPARHPSTRPQPQVPTAGGRVVRACASNRSSSSANARRPARLSARRIAISASRRTSRLCRSTSRLRAAARICSRPGQRRSSRREKPSDRSRRAKTAENGSPVLRQNASTAW